MYDAQGMYVELHHQDASELVSQLSILIGEPLLEQSSRQYMNRAMRISNGVDVCILHREDMQGYY